MFYDRLDIDVTAGRGGDGSASFRREAHVPRGGADGGDGGAGGSVILRADSSRRDFAHLRRTHRWRAGDGGQGLGRRRHGARGDDVVIMVPCGTQAYDHGGRKLCDLKRDGEEAVIARGGRGGFGNTHFVSSVRRAPAFAEIGEPGEEDQVELRLKLMADAALIGLPNAGKSSMLRRISNARPKVGDYPFTTLAPVLGTVERPDGSQVIVVDVPGLIEGASEGHGLGHDFLPHLERARVLLHCVSLEHDDPAEELRVVNREIFAYDPQLTRLPQIVLLTKADLVDDEAMRTADEAVRKLADEHDRFTIQLYDVVPVSSATGFGLTDFIRVLFRCIAEHGESTPDAVARTPHGLQLDDYRVYRPRARGRRFRIFRERGEFRIMGDDSLRGLAERAEHDGSALEELNAWLEDSGALRSLRLAGMGDGTTVNICGIPFEQ